MLNIIYGKSGSGKSKKLYSDIKENLSNEKIFLIVPEQSNLSAEQNLIKELEVSSLINVQVLTLSRMAFRIFEEVGGKINPTLSQSGKAMIVYDILKNEEKNLKFLGKSDKNIDVVINMITELKKHNITESVLDDIDVSDTYTKLKLEDIKLILKRYNEKLQDKFIDENDILTVVSEKIQYSSMFDNSLIYIDDFIGFTPQEYKVFEELMKKCEKITVALSTDSLEKGDKELDIFYFNKIFADKLIDIAKRNGKKVQTVHLEENLRAKNDEIKFLEDALSDKKFKQYKEETKNISLFLANNSYSEMEFVANEILKLVKNDGYKYNEIAITTGSIEAQALEAKIIFDKYNIPIFIDEKKDLNQNILIKYILAIVEIFSKNWSFESVFNYLKLGMLDVSNYDIFALENYCKKWGIKYYKWFKPFTYEELNENQEKLENLRKMIVEPLLKLKDNFEKKTVKEITKAIYEFLIQNNINEILDNKIKSIGSIEINSEYNTSYKILVSILDELVNIFGDEKVSFDKYKDLLQIGFSQSDLGKIPIAQDQVILGDSKRSRNNNIKVNFICGINDGVFPTVNKFEGFLNDSDREILKSNGMEIAKTSLELLYSANFEIYNALSIASEKLYLSYCSSDKEGKSIRPSILIKKIKRIFPNLKEDSDIITKSYYITNEMATFDDAIIMYKRYLDGEEISDEWKTLLNYYKNTQKEKFEKTMEGLEYTNQAQQISEENIQKMYGNNLKTSVSRLEQYKKCPFSFHLKYGLKLKENPELKIQTVDTGTFMHEIIDEFFEVLEERKIDIKEITDEEVQKIVSEIIEITLEMSKYYIFSSTAKFKILTNRLKKVISESINYIIYTMKNSKFECLGHEIEFGANGKYKPIVMNLENGKRVEITGKIDRVDVGKIDDKNYVRIIDYKSSIKNIDLNQVEAGLQIQLITYLDAISKQDNFDPSGILYLGLVDNIVKANKNMNDEQIKEEIRKKFRMNGLVLANIDIIKMMDTKLQEGSSDIIPVTLKKSGEISDKSSAIKEEEFTKLQEKVSDIVKQISNEILNGKIDIKPYNDTKHTGCDYCEYKSICMFNPNFKNNSYNYIGR